MLKLTAINNMKDLLIDQMEWATKEMEASEPKDITKIENAIYCKFCGVLDENDCKCNDSAYQYNGEE